MTVIIDGTNGVQSVGGSASTASFTKDGDTNNGIFFPATDVTAITTAGSERLRVDASGNLGLGVTPSAWSVVKAFQIQRSSFSAYSDNTPNASTQISSNAFYDGSWKYIANIGAAQYEQATSGGGAHKWFVAGTGTAGNAITFTQAMTLDASGNLGVGTTSPACRLHVDGQEVRLNASSGPFYSLYAAGTREFYLEASAGAVNLIGTTNKPMVFGTNNGEKARITSGGALCVNTTNDNFYLVVNGAACAHFGDGYDSNNYGVVQITRPENQPDNKFHLSFIRAGQKVAGMGFLDNSNTFAVQNASNNAGSGVTLTDGATSWGTTSDERKKNILGNVDNAMAKMASWRSVYYRYKIDKEDAPQRIGLIAQDVQATVPEAVSVEDDEIGTLQLRYSEVIPVLVKAIQELSAKVAALEAK